MNKNKLKNLITNQQPTTTLKPPTMCFKMLLASNNNILDYRDSNDNNIYCVYCKILYQIYNTLSYQYISLNKRLCVYSVVKSFIGIQLLKLSLYPFHFTKACFFL